LKSRLFNKVKALLAHRPLDTGDILAKINAESKYGTDLKALGNILGKNPAVFAKDGISHKGQTIWRLKRSN
jgi:hypothetical protein